MSQDVDIRQFFRKAPKEWLRKYFERREVLLDFDWSAITTRNVEPLVDAWLTLDSDHRGHMVTDFESIKLLATPAGKVQIIDEAAYHDVRDEVARKLTDLEDLYACAFWLLLEQPKCWNGAVFYAAADAKPKRYWRKRINMPRMGRAPTQEDASKLAVALTDLFRRKEGRGDFCVVHPYRRGGGSTREYYFAYPQDHKQTAIEYDKGEMTKRPHNPAFEIVFIHDDEAQTLAIWHAGTMDRVKDLQVAFASAVIGVEIPRDSQRDDRVYDLECFLVPHFALQPAPELGIASVELRKIGVRIPGPEPYVLAIELGAKTPSHVLQERLEAATRDIKSSMLKVIRVGLRVTFEKKADEHRSRQRSFELVSPNSCSLQNDIHSVAIQRMLADHGIEPKRKTHDEASDGGKD